MARARPRAPAVRGLYDDLHIDIYPPSLQPSDGAYLQARQLLRPVAFAGASDDAVRTDIADRVGSPLAYLTFGTVFSEYGLFAAASALEALAASPRPRRSTRS